MLDIMSKYRFFIFAIIMSFCTSTAVSAVIIFFNFTNGDFFQLWLNRFLVAWPTVFIGILVFVPLINKGLDIFLEKKN